MKKHYFKRLISGVTALALALGCAGTAAFAEEPDAIGGMLIIEGEALAACDEYETGEIVENEFTAEFDGLSNDELFFMYLNDEAVPMPEGSHAEEYLTSYNKNLYDCLKPMIKDVADGKRTSTAFTFSPASIGITKTTFTVGKGKEIDADVNTSDLTPIRQALAEMYPINYGLTVAFLRADCPAEFYWFDKTIGYTSQGIPYTYSYNKSTGKVSGITLKDFTMKFTVAYDYRVSDYETDSAKISAAKKAIANARTVVAEQSGKSDYEKLLGYKDAICSRVRYDYDALNKSTSVVGINPWQLVNVFDGDPDTNVVCEGYSKAFQYLCDLTSFSGDVECYTVSGSAGGGHMWNLVAIDGSSYLVDITNCDGGPAPEKYGAGYYDNLFLAGAEKKGDYTYTVKIPKTYVILDYYGGDRKVTTSYFKESSLTYTYYSGEKGHDNIPLMYGEKLIKLSETNYVPDPSVSGLSINEKNFPDKAFRSYVSENFDKDSDGRLSAEEISAVTAVDVSKKNVTNLKGVEYFTALEKLYCEDNSISELDITGNTALTELGAAGNKLAGIDLSRNKALRSVYLGRNAFTELDVSGCMALEKLYCDSNRLSRLDVSKNTALKELCCGNNMLTCMDLSGNASLEVFDCAGNTFKIGKVSSYALKNLIKYGFDPDKASAWNGAEYDAAKRSLINFTSDEIAYSYDCGNGFKAVFILLAETPDPGFEPEPESPLALITGSGDEAGFNSWSELIAAVNRGGNSDCVIYVNKDMNIGKFTMPKKGAFSKLTIVSENDSKLTFTGNITLTGDTTFTGVGLDSVKPFNISAGKFAASVYDVSAPMLNNLTSSADVYLGGVSFKGNVAAKTVNVCVSETDSIYDVSVGGSLKASAALCYADSGVSLFAGKTVNAGSIVTGNGAKLYLSAAQKAPLTVGKAGIIADGDGKEPLTVALVDGSGSYVKITEDTVLGTMNWADFSDEIVPDENCLPDASREYMAVISNKKIYVLAVSAPEGEDFNSDIVYFGYEKGSESGGAYFRNYADALKYMNANKKKLEGGHLSVEFVNTVTPFRLTLPSKGYKELRLKGSGSTVLTTGDLTVTGEVYIDGVTIKKVTSSDKTTAQPIGINTGAKGMTLYTVSGGFAEGKLKTISGKGDIRFGSGQILRVSGKVAAGEILIYTGSELYAENGFAASIKGDIETGGTLHLSAEKYKQNKLEIGGGNIVIDIGDNISGTVYFAAYKGDEALIKCLSVGGKGNEGAKIKLIGGYLAAVK